MRKGKVSIEELEDLYGADLIVDIDLAERVRTNRVGFNGKCQGDEFTEWATRVEIPHDAVVTAYYYTDNAQDELLADEDDPDETIDLWHDCLQGYELE